MKRLRKYSLPVVAAAILAVALTLVAPRAVHAVAAALVNVTNTAASPAISQSVSKLASQNVYLSASVSLGGISTFVRRGADGILAGPNFVVPSGQSLIVTGIDVFPSTQLGNYVLYICNSVSSVCLINGLAVPAIYTKEFLYPSGIVFRAGDSVQLLSDSSSPNGATVDMHGYLTSN